VARGKGEDRENTKCTTFKCDEAFSNVVKTPDDSDIINTKITPRDFHGISEYKNKIKKYTC
jgi:hypothetical protein